MDGELLKRLENTVGMEKLLFTSNFSFSYRVFKRFVLQTRNPKGFSVMG